MSRPPDSSRVSAVGRGATAALLPFALAAAIAATGCLSPAYVPRPHEPVPEPRTDEVASVLFLVGDAGAARRESSPLMHRLRADVEDWSAALARDSAVSVLFLGDNIYPVGLRPRSHRHFAQDSARLHAQVWTLSGPAAVRHRSLGLFVPGNHDWGNLAGPEGVARVRHQAEALASHALTGPHVTMTPEAGTPGPGVLDLPGDVRVVTLGTHWWLLSERQELRDAFLARVGDALRDAGGRTVVLAAHHPYASAGPHSGVLSTSLDPLWLLRRTGAVVQDLNSRPFRRLRRGLAGTFEAAGRPFLFAAGHDHSLQLLAAREPSDPEWTLVSGAASKLTGVAEAEALEWASTEPGYMKLLFLNDGGVVLLVETVGPEAAVCLSSDRAECIERGKNAFRRSYSKRLR